MLACRSREYLPAACHNTECAHNSGFRQQREPCGLCLQYYRGLQGIDMSTNVLVNILDKVDGELNGGGRLFASEQ